MVFGTALEKRKASPRKWASPKLKHTAESVSCRLAFFDLSPPQHLAPRKRLRGEVSTRSMGALGCCVVVPNNQRSISLLAWSHIRDTSRPFISPFSNNVQFSIKTAHNLVVDFE